MGDYKYGGYKGRVWGGGVGGVSVGGGKIAPVSKDASIDLLPRPPFGRLRRTPIPPSIEESMVVSYKGNRMRDDGNGLLVNEG